MGKKFFKVPEFRQMDAGVYEKRMDEGFLYHLLGNVDVSLLEQDFIGLDAACDRGGLLAGFHQEAAKAKISSKLDIPVKAVKRKMHYLIKTAYGIAAAVLLLGAAAVWFVKKAEFQQN